MFSFRVCLRCFQLLFQLVLLLKCANAVDLTNEIQISGNSQSPLSDKNSMQFNETSTVATTKTSSARWKGRNGEVHGKRASTLGLSFTGVVFRNGMVSVQVMVPVPTSRPELLIVPSPLALEQHGRICLGDYYYLEWTFLCVRRYKEKRVELVVEYTIHKLCDVEIIVEELTTSNSD